MRKKTREEKINNPTRKHVGFPTMTARQNWGKYFAGMGTEVLYSFLVYAIGAVLAVIALAVFK